MSVVCYPVNCVALLNDLAEGTVWNWSLASLLFKGFIYLFIGVQKPWHFDKTVENQYIFVYFELSLPK